MARSRFLRFLQELTGEFRLGEATRRPADEVHGERAELAAHHLERRKFLLGAGAVAAGTIVACSPLAEIGRKSSAAGGGGGGGGGKPPPIVDQRIAIVGAGMAGLAAGVRLRDAGIVATLYESQTRVGGRLLTERAPATSCGLCHSAKPGANTGWADGQYVDVFGELIDSPGYWSRVWDLASRFGCTMIDMWAGQPAGSTDTFYFNGGYYPIAQVIADFAPVYAAVSADAKAAGYPTTYASSKPAGRVLDNMTVYDWIESRVPGGHSSRMGKLLDVHYNIEYGAETTQQSALNLVYLLAYQPKPVTFSVFGQSDERYKLAGGIDTLTTAMANHLGWNNIKLGYRLNAIERLADGRYDLYFDGRATVRAEVVLLALPFAALRAHVDLSKAGFSPLKLKAINEQGTAHNLKMALQFTDRYWNQPGPWGVSNGNLAADLGFQYGWDATRGVPGKSGILVNYTGGAVTDGQALKHPYGNQGSNDVLRDANAFLAKLEVMFPGISQRWNGKVSASKAHLDPNYCCSYGNYLPGQYQAICGCERVPENNVFFAGEHTSVDYFGFFEGAAQEGWSAGDAILSALRLASASPRARRAAV